MPGHTGWRSEEICNVLMGLGCGLRPLLHRPFRPESLNATDIYIALDEIETHQIGAHSGAPL